MASDELVHEIGQMIVSDEEIAIEAWDKLAVVVHIGDSAREMNGFLYSGDAAPRPSTPGTSGLLRSFRNLREAMFAEGRSKTKWQACVAKIDAESGEITMDFEYENPEKWLVTPSTMKAVAELVRPE
jgi:hypothetical protein